MQIIVKIIVIAISSLIILVSFGIMFFRIKKMVKGKCCENCTHGVDSINCTNCSSRNCRVHKKSGETVNEQSKKVR